MNTDLLRSWLGLPPGPWPPDDRTLLGLGPAADAASAERRGLELMGRLRPHQLRHPDLVTEGMNRLAQALLAVTALGPSAQTRELVAAPADGYPEVDLQAVLIEPVQPNAEPEPPLPVVRPASPERAPAPRLRAVPPPPAPAPRPPGRRVEPPAVGPLDVPRPPPPFVGRRAVDRRRAYRELAALRAVRRAWEKLLPFFADPAESLPTAGHVFEFLEAVDALRSALARPGRPADLFPATAPLTTAVTAHPLSLAVFRSLTVDQRRRVAHDWAVGRAALAVRSDRLRTAVRAVVPSRGAAARLASASAVLWRNPELLLVAGTVAALSAAVLRGVLG